MIALCKSFAAVMTDRNAFRPKLVTCVRSAHDSPLDSCCVKMMTSVTSINCFHICSANRIDKWNQNYISFQHL